MLVLIRSPAFRKIFLGGALSQSCIIIVSPVWWPTTTCIQTYSDFSDLSWFATVLRSQAAHPPGPTAVGCAPRTSARRRDSHNHRLRTAHLGSPPRQPDTRGGQLTTAGCATHTSVSLCLGHRSTRRAQQCTDGAQDLGNFRLRIRNLPPD